jgi:hypothetical protein
MTGRERFEHLVALVAAGKATPAQRDELDKLRAAVPLPSPASSTTADRSAKKRWSAADWFAIAACIVVLAGMAYLIFGPQKPDHTIPILAPRGETGFAQPMLIWEADADQRYDVWILPTTGSHVDTLALFFATNVQPPIALTNLQPGPALPNAPLTLSPNRKYRLLVSPANAGRLAGTVSPFQTTPDAGTKVYTPDFFVARQLAATNRLSDALTLLRALPPNIRERPEVQNLESELRTQLLAPPESRRDALQRDP